MSSRVLAGFLVAASLAVSAQAALGATPDNRLAAAALVTKGDLGAGTWTSKPASGTSDSCGIILDLKPKLAGLDQTAILSGPVFADGANQALTQTVRIFATPAEASTAWARTVNNKLVICMEEQVEGTSGMSAPVSVTDWKRLRLPKLPTKLQGFRVVATAKTGPKTTATIYFDAIVLDHARTLTKLVFSSVGKPFSASLEASLASVVSKRLHSA